MGHNIWRNSNVCPTCHSLRYNKFNLSRWSRTASMTLKKLVNIMSSNIAENVVGCRFNGLQDGETRKPSLEAVIRRNAIYYNTLNEI